MIGGGQRYPGIYCYHNKNNIAPRLFRDLVVERHLLIKPGGFFLSH